MITQSTIRANDIDFAYLEAGPQDGPLALCLHGFPDHAPTFNAMLPALAERGYHAVAPWMRGYTPTGPAPDGHYQSATLAMDAVALIEKLGQTDESVVIGHDWGAVAACGAAALAPDKVSRVVSMALPHPAVALGKLGGDWSQLKRAWYMWFFQLDEAPEAALTAEGSLFVDGLWADWSPGFQPSSDILEPIKKLLSEPESASAAVEYYRQTINPRRQVPELAETQETVMGGTITVPAMFIGGADDGCFSSDYLAESVAYCTHEPRIEVVPDCGHFLHVERPDAVNEIVLDFVTAQA